MVTTAVFGEDDKLLSSSLRPLYFVDLTNMNLTSEDLSRLCKRFRVLIIGRQNAGKSTVLEKMTSREVIYLQ